jgi:hypothetical protein
MTGVGRGRRLDVVAVSAVSAALVHIGFFSWDRDTDVDAVTGSTSGPYDTWQIACSTVALALIAYYGGRARHAWAASAAASVAFTTVWAVGAATAAGEDANLWPIGAALLLPSTFVPMLVVGPDHPAPHSTAACAGGPDPGRRSDGSAAVTCPAATGHAPTHLEQEEQPLPTTIPGLVSRRIRVDHDIELNVAIGGSGPPLVLLHGFPQTHLMWRHVVAELIADHTVICPDLRGYGDSDKPVASDAGTYSKRTMAEDVVRVGRSLGHDRFALAGHDRGALVGDPRRNGPPGGHHPPGVPRRPPDNGHLGGAARPARERRLAPLPHGAAARAARGHDTCRPAGRPHVADAGHGAPAGLGRRPRVRRRPAVEVVG